MLNPLKVSVSLATVLFSLNSYAATFIADFEPNSSWYGDASRGLPPIQMKERRNNVQEFLDELSKEFTSNATVRIYFTDDGNGKNYSATAGSFPANYLGSYYATVAWRRINQNYQGHALYSKDGRFEKIPNKGDGFIHWNFDKNRAANRNSIRILVRHEMTHILGMTSVLDSCSSGLSGPTCNQGSSIYLHKYDLGLHFGDDKRQIYLETQVDTNGKTTYKIANFTNDFWFKGLESNGSTRWLKVQDNYDFSHLNIVYGKPPYDINDDFRSLFRALGYKLSIDSLARNNLATQHTHNCKINDNKMLDCWGYNYDGASVPPAGEYVDIAVSNMHSCAINTQGIINCWGSEIASPETRNPIQGQYKRLVSGSYKFCGITTDDAAVCWGKGSSNPPSNAKIKQLDLGGYHSCAILQDDSIQCWGSNHSGAATPPSGSFKQLSVNSSQNCAIDFVGHISCWGQDTSGETNPPTGTFTQVSMGWRHACAIKAEGTVTCWGLNDSGQASPPNGQFINIKSGFKHTCGTRPNKSIECWGSNQNGELNVP
ncbi:RCC1 domain-containing protein [Zooshikella harenae]|uniref:non-specific serine/threonine protein kinase n=1 Tax=Zooshikella harenae TaxID=2827238 RepID=A0ABS5ZDF3_9GAMM|nr:hypothetical protein [Zooshikella harenae]MBU2712019.1 hypothetical protein [Zooshikella harenae]